MCCHDKKLLVWNSSGTPPSFAGIAPSSLFFHSIYETHSGPCLMSTKPHPSKQKLSSMLQCRRSKAQTGSQPSLTRGLKAITPFAIQHPSGTKSLPYEVGEMPSEFPPFSLRGWKMCKILQETCQDYSYVGSIFRQDMNQKKNTSSGVLIKKNTIEWCSSSVKKHSFGLALMLIRKEHQFWCSF